MPELISIKRKIMLVGNPAVGKTSLVRRFVLDQFSDEYIMSIGFKVMKKTMLYQGQDNEIELNLMIWDMMGQIECKLMPPTAYGSAHGALIICDLTRKETLENLTHLTSSLFSIIPHIPIIYAANKNDLTDKIQFSDLEIGEITQSFRSPYYKTSAKTGENVELLFQMIGKRILLEQGILT